MRLLVCGGRDYTDRETLYNSIADVLNWKPEGEEANDTWLPPKGTVIISGGAPGADTLAIDWAVVHWVPFEEYKAEWAKYGKKAGPLRNKRMLDEGKPDHVLAAPGGKGTANMIALATAAGVPITYASDNRRRSDRVQVWIRCGDSYVPLSNGGSGDGGNS